MNVAEVLSGADVRQEIFCEEPKTELIGGVLIMPPSPMPIHNRRGRRIINILENYLFGKTAELFYETDVHLTENDIYRPDIMIVCDPEKIKEDGIYGAPDLVVEILSPSTEKYDRGGKMEVYGQCGVKEYWLVDTEKLSVEVYLQTGDSDLCSLNLHNIYAIGSQAQFKTSLFDDLLICLEDIFYELI